MKSRVLRSLDRGRYLIYAVALTVSARFAFGGRGIVAAMMTLGVWTTIFRRREFGPLQWFLITVALFVSALLLLPALEQARSSARRLQCKNNLHRFGIALHNYHDDYGVFPPAVTRNESGQPMHSWRVLLLPYVDQIGLFSQYKLDEPWDSPHNRQLADQMPPIYRCPSHPHHGDGSGRTLTSYVAVVGDESAWMEEGSRSLEDFGDHAASTVQLTEWAGVQIPWTEPRDLSVEEARTPLGRRLAPNDWPGHPPREDYFYEYEPSWHVAFADGSVKAFGHSIEPDVWASLLRLKTGSTDEQIGRVEVGRLVKRHPRWRNWIALGSFLFLALLPLAWVWRKPVQCCSICHQRSS